MDAKIETILNIYLIIENNLVTGFKAKNYYHAGSDEEKIKHLKENAKLDFKDSVEFGAPVNRWGRFMKYRKFAKLEEQGMHFQLFEPIFTEYKVPDNPLICVTPVVDGKILAD